MKIERALLCARAEGILAPGYTGMCLAPSSNLQKYFRKEDGKSNANWTFITQHSGKERTEFAK
jgi:hypothetical protein